MKILCKVIKELCNLLVEFMLLASAFFTASCFGYASAKQIDMPFYVSFIAFFVFIVLIMLYGFFYWRLPLILKKDKKEEKDNKVE